MRVCSEPGGAEWVTGVPAATGHLSVATAVITWVTGQAVAAVILVAAAVRRFGGFGRSDMVLANETLRFGVRAHAGRIMLLGNY